MSISLMNTDIRVITFGTFDLLHQGHLHILRRARALGNYLIVGISTDKLNYEKKKQYPVISESNRIDLVSELKCVNEVFLEESLELKRHYIKKYKADILVMGDDWVGKFDFVSDISKVIYLPRTPEISTTLVKDTIRRLK